MSEEKSLIVGFDLCDDFSQISYFNMKTFEPESIHTDADEESYLIPTVLGVMKDSYEWCFGKEAVALSKKGEAILIDHLLTQIRDEKEIIVLDTKFNGASLLEKFFRKALSLLKIKHPNDTIDHIIITLRELDQKLIENIYKALEGLSILKDRVLIQSHEQSFVYYTLSQKKELWMNDVGMFDLSEPGLNYYQITIDRRHTPNIVSVSNKDYSETLSYDLFQEHEKNENLSYIFSNIAKNVLYKQIVSTLFFTGKGFEGNWADEVMKELCASRRIFKGQNLYAKGACYAARAVKETDRFKDFIILSDEMIRSSISMKVYYNAQISDIMLAKAGTAWYEIDQIFELILDDQDEIEITTRDIIKNESVKHIIALDGLPNRPKRMTRILVKVKFMDKSTCVVTAKDEGFGEFYPSTNRIWEKVFTI